MPVPRPQFSGVRIIEAVIIAVVTAVGSAGATVYTQQKVMETKFHTLNIKIDEVRNTFERRIDRVERDFYIPRGSDARPPELLRLPPPPSALASRGEARS